MYINRTEGMLSARRNNGEVERERTTIYQARKVQDHDRVQEKKNKTRQKVDTAGGDHATTTTAGTPGSCYQYTAIGRRQLSRRS